MTEEEKQETKVNEKKISVLKPKIDIHSLSYLFLASQKMTIDGFLNGDEEKMRLGVCIGNIIDKSFHVEDLLNEGITLLMVLYRLDDDTINKLNKKVGEIISQEGDELADAFGEVTKMLHERQKEEEEAKQNAADRTVTEPDSGANGEGGEQQESSS